MDASQGNRILSFPSFRFVVKLGNESVAAFTECTLPSIEWDVEEVKEGGLNTFVHQLPGRRRAGRVSLKNGVAKSSLVDWFIQAMKESFERKTVTIMRPAFHAVRRWRSSHRHRRQFKRMFSIELIPRTDSRL